MASHIDYIRSIIINENLIHLENSLDRISLKRLDESPLKKAVLEVYEDLGGVGDLPNVDYEIDIELFQKGIIIDDDLHFNKYRTITLRSSIYDMMPEFPRDSYRRYCRTHEKQCLKAGSNGILWSNTISEKHFGKSNDNGDLGLTGSSAWKMRAYQDYLADLSSCIFDHKIVRISMYDTLLIGGKLTQLRELIISRKPENERHIISLIKQKISASNVRIDPFGKKI